MAKVTRIAFDRRSKAKRKLDKFDELPSFDPVRNTKGDCELLVTESTFYVLMSDGEGWQKVAAFTLESVRGHMADRRYLRHCLLDEVKRSECQHDYKGGHRRRPGKYCVKCHEPRPRKWTTCNEINTKCLNERGLMSWSRKVCDERDIYCRRRKGHDGDCSWGGSPRPRPNNVLTLG